jgi:hypothetical protein
MSEKERYGRSFSSHGGRGWNGIDKGYSASSDSLEGLSEVSGSMPQPSPEPLDDRFADVQQDYQQLRIDTEEGR